jgi:hypothetical protein
VWHILSPASITLLVKQFHRDVKSAAQLRALLHKPQDWEDKWGESLAKVFSDWQLSPQRLELALKDKEEKAETRRINAANKQPTLSMPAGDDESGSSGAEEPGAKRMRPPLSDVTPSLNTSLRS